MRLRMLDIHTPLFWLVVFAQRTYGEPLFSLSIYAGNSLLRWGFSFWRYEEIPANGGEEEGR